MSILELFNDNKIAASNFINLVHTLVRRGKNDFENLPVVTKNEIVGLLLKCLNFPLEFIDNKDIKKFVELFSDYLIFGKTEIKDKSYNVLMQHALDFYSLDLQDYFDLISDEIGVKNDN